MVTCDLSHLRQIYITVQQILPTPHPACPAFLSPLLSLYWQAVACVLCKLYHFLFTFQLMLCTSHWQFFLLIPQLHIENKISSTYVIQMRGSDTINRSKYCFQLHIPYLLATIIPIILSQLHRQVLSTSTPSKLLHKFTSDIHYNQRLGVSGYRWLSHL